MFEEDLKNYAVYKDFSWLDEASLKDFKSFLETEGFTYKFIEHDEIIVPEVLVDFWDSTYSLINSCMSPTAMRRLPIEEKAFQIEKAYFKFSDEVNGILKDKQSVEQQINILHNSILNYQKEIIRLEKEEK
jgi:hypothetical protein